jgi:hypothetical protein
LKEHRTVETKPGYNGWANYETWNVMLWMNNDEPRYRNYVAVVRAAKREKKLFTGECAKSFCETQFTGKTPDGVSIDSSKIRWGAIARAMRESA